MSRLAANNIYLQSVVDSSTKSRNKLFSRGTDEEIKTVFEILFNCISLKWNKPEEKKLAPTKQMLKVFHSTRWDLESFREFAIKNSKKVELVVSLVLNKLVDGQICDILNDGV